MKTEIEVTEADVSRTLRFNTSPAPSLQVPVTAANRALLRWLRREELSAWEAGRICRCGSFTAVSPTIQEYHQV
jgi:aerobic-type carbon monoxide dehydrogenase small subunit (CoxS/CutS family)